MLRVVVLVFDTTFSVDSFSVAKTPQRNEDAFRWSGDRLVLADGATDKTGLDFGGKTGGEIASQVAAEVALRSSQVGVPLVEEVTVAIREVYRQQNPRALDDSAARFATTLVVARIVGDELIVTRVGDSSFRINGRQEFTNGKAIDEENALARQRYIQLALASEVIPASEERRRQIMTAAREAILPRLKLQHLEQNNPDSPYGYGVLDGGVVPQKFVEVHRFPLAAVTSVELMSDGFFDAFPAQATTDAWRELHRRIHREDPDKYLRYLSTKSNDDATVIVAHLK